MVRSRGGVALAALALSCLAVCDGEVPLTAPEGATLTIEANPKSIAAVGGRSRITVVAFKAAGDGGGTVADGTQIFFTTDLGRIEERVETVNGIAQAMLQSDGRAGTATITAQSGGGITALTTTVQIGAGAEGDLVITVIANPTTLGPEDLTSEIVATVTDNRGNALADVPVIFSTSSGTLASQGSVLRTNASGQAFDRLTLLDDSDQAEVTATSGSVSASVTVTRGDFGEPLIDSVSPATGTRGASLTVTITGQNFQQGATASFGEGIGINDVTWINSEILLVDITIDGSASSDPRTVTVTNPDGGQGTFASAFTVSSRAPVCRMTVSPLTSGTGTSADPWVMSSSLVAFNGTTSSDPDGGPLTFDWDVGDPPTGNFTTASFSYDFSTPSPPPYQVVLTVTDEDGDFCTLTRFLDVP
jgi:adhesin/invasin